MAKGTIGIFNPDDRRSIIEAARRLKVDPYEFAAVLSLESGPNIDPNIWSKNGYYSVIQFGGPERQKYLDASKIGKYTRAELLKEKGPVESFLVDRGFKPGEMGIDRLYSTILAGNPNDLNSEDSNGTTAAGSVRRFKKGGDLHNNAIRVLGDISSFSPSATPSKNNNAGTQSPGLPITPNQTATSPVTVNFITGKIDPKNQALLRILGVNQANTIDASRIDSRSLSWSNPFSDALAFNNSPVDKFLKDYLNTVNSVIKDSFNNTTA